MSQKKLAKSAPVPKSLSKNIKSQKNKSNSSRGSILLMDIGRESTKVVELAAVSKSKNELTVLRHHVIKHPHHSVSDDSIENIGLLLDEIATNLQKVGIYTRSVVVSTSLFPISVDTISTGDSIPKNKDSSIAVCYQQYNGKIVSSSCSSYYLKTFISEFQKIGYKVVSVESPVTPMLNLAEMLTDSYTYPDKLIVEFGSSTNLYGLCKATPMFIHSFKYKLLDMIKLIAQGINEPVDVVQTVFRKVGLVDTEENRSILETEYQINAQSYYNSTVGFTKQYLSSLKSHILKQLAENEFDKTQMLITGGFSDVPGFYSLVEQAFSDNTLVPHKLTLAKTTTINEKITIKNRSLSSSPVSGVYGGCVGLALKQLLPKSCNLVSAIGANKTKAVIAIKAAVLVLSAILPICLGFALSLSLKQIDTIPKKDIKTIEAQQENADAMLANLSYKLQTQQDLDKNSTKLLGIVLGYEDEMVTLVSIEKPNNNYVVRGLAENGVAVARFLQYVSNKSDAFTWELMDSAELDETESEKLVFEFEAIPEGNGGQS